MAVFVFQFLFSGDRCSFICIAICVVYIKVLGQFAQFFTFSRPFFSALIKNIWHKIASPSVYDFILILLATRVCLLSALRTIVVKIRNKQHISIKWCKQRHPVQEKTTLWVHLLKNDNVGSAQQTLWVQNGGKWKSGSIRKIIAAYWYGRLFFFRVSHFKILLKMVE